MRVRGWTWSVQSGSVAAAHVTRFQMSRTVLALMPYRAPTARDRALSERPACPWGESTAGRMEYIWSKIHTSGKSNVEIESGACKAFAKVYLLR